MGAMLSFNDDRHVALGWRGPELRLWNVDASVLHYEAVRPNDTRFEYLGPYADETQELGDRLNALLHLQDIPDHAHTQSLVDMAIRACVANIEHTDALRISNEQVSQELREARERNDILERHNAAQEVLVDRGRLVARLMTTLVSALHPLLGIIHGRLSGSVGSLELHKLEDACQQAKRAIDDPQLVLGPEVTEDLFARRTLRLLAHSVQEFFHDQEGITSSDLDAYAGDILTWLDAGAEDEGPPSLPASSLHRESDEPVTGTMTFDPGGIPTLTDPRLEEFVVPERLAVQRHFLPDRPFLLSNDMFEIPTPPAQDHEPDF